MTELPAYPGGYTRGVDALEDLVRLSQLLNAAHDCRDRLRLALEEIDLMITRTNGARADALRSVDRFADENPASLGVRAGEQLEGGLEEIESNLSALEREVADVVTRAGGLS